MKKAKPATGSLFWLKHVFLAVLVIVIAVIVLVMQQRNESAVLPEGDAGKKSIASNMSNFYADYRSSSRGPIEQDLGDFVMGVKTSDKPLSERLKKMESLQNPISGRWVGDHKHRTFKAGSTLRSAITSYAQSEGMQVIWELDQDFIVKHPFQLDDSMLGSLKIIANAIDANFEGEVKAYMCPRQRSLVITSTASDYLTKQCAEARN
ncbi:toxin co-regulated pilus biosynthesis Q family protein [uncultured Paraglaciecola sp.]|uniref:toxin co-regulated pilus biosynthesis Q family protein n=1 Tax=uncultured Paraglaciecola sp. TaxID=1765024 RepID=UPI002611E17B|nr:toxin co-regulated pilus biosynthesis Q family protein [uncultured Paraglaciecola sp.]